MSDFLKEELERSRRDRVKIPVTNEIYIELDKSDTWFSINDTEGDDCMGGVMLSVDMIDPLIKALGQVLELFIMRGTKTE